MSGRPHNRFGFRRDSATGLALLSALLIGSSFFSGAFAQGASDNQGERQVDPQIVQNPIIPGQVDPEPPFTTAKQDAVLTRPRKEYEPIGIEAGGVIRDIKYLGRGQILESFLLFPKVDTSIVFDTNIFADANNKTADFIGTVKPELTLQSNWDNHAFFIRGFGEFGRFLSNSRENFRRHGVEIGGRADITEFLRLTPKIGWQRKTAARSDVDADAGGDEPTVFYESFGELRLDYQRDKFLYAGKSKITVKDFVDSPAGIAEIENDQNDNWLWENSHRFGWEWWRGSTFFVQPFLNVNRFFINPDNAGVTRGFTSFGAVAGYTYDLTAVTFFEGSFGLGFASPRDRLASSFAFIDGSLDFVWNPHDSWTFKAGWDRSLAPTNSFTVVGGNNVPDVAFLNDKLSLEAQLEVTYELLASAKIDLGLASTTQNNTTQTGIDTELALLWLMNEHARLRGFWQFETLTSNDANREFSKHILGVVLTLHY